MQRKRCVCTATAWMLTVAQCSAIPQQVEGVAALAALAAVVAPTPWLSFAAFGCFLLMQLMIMATGNFGCPS